MSGLRFLWSAPMAGLAVGLAMAGGDDLRLAGQRQFLRCNACHAIAPGDPARIGPHLQGIVGRPAAGLADHPYTEDLRARDFTWDAARLEAWLENPQEMVPGMCLPFLGLSDPQARRALLAYLEILAP